MKACTAGRRVEVQELSVAKLATSSLMIWFNLPPRSSREVVYETAEIEGLNFSVFNVRKNEDPSVGAIGQMRDLRGSLKEISEDVRALLGADWVEISPVLYAQVLDDFIMPETIKPLFNVFNDKMSYRYPHLRLTPPSFGWKLERQLHDIFQPFTTAPAAALVSQWTEFLRDFLTEDELHVFGLLMPAAILNTINEDGTNLPRAIELAKVHLSLQPHDQLPNYDFSKGAALARALGAYRTKAVKDGPLVNRRRNAPRSTVDLITHIFDFQWPEASPVNETTVPPANDVEVASVGQQKRHRRGRKKRR